MSSPLPGDLKSREVRRADPAARAAAVHAILARVLYLNLVVVAVKTVAYFSSSALSVLAEVTHSSLDAANNVFALWLAHVAAQGPDADHPYGHQKFETLGALVLVGFLSVTVFELVQGAGRRLLSDTPPEVESTPLALGIMVLSVAVGLLVAAYESRRGKALGSDLLLADAAHTRSDVLTTATVLAGLVVIRAGWTWIDPLVTLLVAAIIALTGWRIVVGSVPVLVDQRAVDPTLIQQLADDHEGVVSSYGIRSRGRTGAIFAELTIAVDPALDVQVSHRIADRVEQRITEALAAHRVVVHVEPAEE